MSNYLKEIREISYAAAKEELEQIEGLIVEAAKEKKCQVYISEMSQAARSYFNSKGLSITYTTNDGYNYLINWA